MSVPDGIAAIGQLGFDTYCGQPDYRTKGGGYDYVEIPDGSCAPPSPGTVTSDRYCGKELNCAQTISSAIAGSPVNTVCTNNKLLRSRSIQMVMKLCLVAPLRPKARHSAILVGSD